MSVAHGAFVGVGRVHVRLFDPALAPIGAHTTTLEKGVTKVINIISVPVGRFLPEQYKPSFVVSDDPLSVPVTMPELIDAPPSPYPAPVPANPTPVAEPAPAPTKPKRGDPGYVRHLHDDDFRRKYGLQ